MRDGLERIFDLVQTALGRENGCLKPWSANDDRSLEAPWRHQNVPENRSGET